MVDLPKTIEDREYRKFDLDTDDNVIVRTSAKGEFRITGLNNGGLITEVEINPTTWTQIPAAPLLGRNAISLQNRTGEEIKINYSDSISGYVGVAVSDGGERAYDITDQILLYAKSSASTVTVVIEEIS